MDARVKPAHDAEFVARTFPHLFSCQTAPPSLALRRSFLARDLVRKPVPTFRGHAHSSAARILCRAPGSPVFPCPSSLSRNVRGDGAPIGAAISYVHAFFSKAWRLSARHTRRFLSLAPCFRAATGPEPDPRSGQLPPPFVAAASSHRRQPVVMPADGWPGPPGDGVTNPARGRRIADVGSPRYRPR